MIRWILAWLLFLPGVAWSQTVVVRSGEHGDFTRLVFRLPEDADWTVTPGEGRNVNLSLSGNDVQFDTSQAFRRINRERVDDLVVQSDGSLEISLACVCKVDPFTDGNNLLVLDIAPGEATTLTAAESGGDGSEAQAGPAPQAGPPDEVMQSATDSQNPLLQNLARVRLGGTPGVGPRRVPDPLLPRLPARAVADRSQNETEGTAPQGAAQLGDDIAADLAAAATAGLLDPAIRSVPTREFGGLAPEPEPVEPSHAAVTADLAQELVAGLTSGEHQRMQGGHVLIGGHGCERDKNIDLAGWVAEDADINAVLSQRRTALFGEFDRIDEAAMVRYAKALLHYGFGAEARSLLKLGDSRPDPALMALSYLVDGAPDPTRYFEGQEACEGYVSLWASLSEPEIDTANQVDHKAVLRSFEALPLHMKPFLGPILAERLTKAGYTNSARDLYRRVERTEGTVSDSVVLGRAQMDLAEGDYAAAAERLKPLSEKGTPETADAIVARVRLAEATDGQLPQRIVDLAEAYTNEMRNTDQGVVLWEAHLNALLLNGAFEQVFKSLDDPDGIPEEVVARTKQAALTRLTEKAGDLTFLKLVIPVRPLGSDDAAAEKTSLDIAARLANIGMPEAALGYINQIDRIKDERRARLIKAEAFLDLGKPEESEINLIGLRGKDVDRLRAEARRQMGDHALAGSLLHDVGRNDAAVTSGWLSGDWAEVADESGSIFSQAAQLVQEEQVAFDPDDPSLQDAERLTQQSSESLQTLRALLDATRIIEGD
ncbi:hypothetical protein [Sagittula salina]|uniref:Tetratricopeptide repeat-containing protein n=1 Tax=Sagittula salina TaxID=2820268 RepID=A0A940S3Z5_9RHOB|nr:hypothetical protein [Sagittula salina]MBP0483335.1 hypothetical protein [Sagittula salina]